MKKTHLDSIENSTGVKAPNMCLELEDGRTVVDLMPVTTRQAVVVDYEIFKLLIEKLPEGNFSTIVRHFIEKLEECGSMADYRSLLAEEFVFHSTIELTNSTDVIKIVKQYKDIMSEAASIKESL